MNTDRSGAVTFAIENTVALITMDDGKANALTHDLLDDLTDAVSIAEKEAKAVVIAGREGKFCAGFDLKVMTSGQENASALLGHGAEFFFKTYMLNVPVIAACTGHALAGGAVILLSTDLRIGEDVDAKIGFNEVAIGMALPRFILEMCRDRLSKRHVPGLNLAKLYDPAGATDAGYLDEVVGVGHSIEAATAVAASLTELHAPSFAATRKRLRGPALERFKSTLEHDLATFTVST